MTAAGRRFAGSPSGQIGHASSEVAIVLKDVSQSGNWRLLMSVQGRSLPNWTIRAMSAFPPIATVQRTSWLVRFVPQAEVPSFDYLVGADKESGRDRQPNGLSGACVQQQLEPARLSHGKISNAGAF
jgi:hypothetical protein